MLIQNTAALLGPDLTYTSGIDIHIADGVFAEISPHIERAADKHVINGSGLLVSPGFINCHTHIGDSIGKDVAAGPGVERRVHPVYGVKSDILRHTLPQHLVSYMRAACRSMLASGTTTFVDFREGGVAGVRLLKQACIDTPIRAIILGRADTYQDAEQIRHNHTCDMSGALTDLLECADGVGISGANEHSDGALLQYSMTQKIRAIHAAETDYSVQESLRITGKREVERAMLARPHFVVHMTRATHTEMNAASRLSGVVACPRANMVLSGRMPNLHGMVSAGCTVALGTDNVMVNSPDMFREMEFAWKASGGSLGAADILRMATVNGGRILGMNIGVIQAGAAADCILFERHHIDMDMMHDPHVALVHRAGPSCIRAVLVSGRVAHGRV